MRSPVNQRVVNTAPSSKANDVLFQAFDLVGTPYKWGGSDPQSGFDCSGLVAYVYDKAVDMSLPRSSREMAQMDAPKISQVSKLKSGDLLFFNTNGRSISHVAIYIGNGRFVHAPNRDGAVRTEELSNPYWGNHFLFAKRPI